MPRALALAASLVVLLFTAGTASATVYPDPGPMPPKGNDAFCGALASGTPCATVSPFCSHIVAPASASNGDTIELTTSPSTPCNAWDYNELPGIQESACYLPDTSGGGGYYVYPWGGVPLNVCKVLVQTGTATIVHAKDGGGWETTSGPGWTKVGVEDICGNACPGYEHEDETWMALTPPPPPPPAPTVDPTVKVPANLKVTFQDAPTPIVVPQDAAGPKPQTVTLTATVTNAGSDTIHSVTFNDPLDIVPVGHTPVSIDTSGCGWANVPPTKGKTPPPCPIEQQPTPPGTAPPTRVVGDLAPGASASVTFKLTVRGDGDYTIYDTVSGIRPDGNGNQVAVNTVGQYHYQPDSQLLVTSVGPPQGKRSPQSNQLFVAGTPFTEKLHLENRSYYRRLLVLPRIELSGNVVGGVVQEVGDPVANDPPSTGDPTEVIPTPIIELAPRASHDYVVVFWSTQSNAIQTSAKPAGGTRGTVQFDPPLISTEDDDAVATDQDVTTRLVAPAGTFDPQTIHIDDSQPKQVPVSLKTGGLAFTNGAFNVIWRATATFVNGLWELVKTPYTAARYGIPALLQYNVELQSQLWKEIQGDPQLMTLYENALSRQILLAYRFAPSLALKPNEIFNIASDATGQEMSRIYSEWLVGDWQGATNDLTTETGNGIGGVVSLVGGPRALTKTLALAGDLGVLSRMQPILDAAATRIVEETAEGEKAIAQTGAEADIAEADRAAVKDGEDAHTLRDRASAEEAVRNLLEENKLKPGETFDPSNPGDLKKLYAASGIPPEELQQYADLAKGRGENLVSRSRGVGAADRLKEGAYLKPFEIKAKNMGPLDRFLFGWPKKFQDLVMIDADLPYRSQPIKKALAAFGEDLQARGLEPGTDSYDGALNRYKTQYKQTNVLLKQYRKWAATSGKITSKATGKVRGVFHGVADLTWDATENPRDFAKLPEFNPKATTRVQFRLQAYDEAGGLVDHPYAPGSKARYFVPEIKPHLGDWGAISGDVDWLSFATAQGEQLEDASNLSLLNDLSHFGAQHPESASWVLLGKGGESQFLFDAKIGFLSGYDTIGELEKAGGIGKQVNFEFGADGKIRTVVLDYHASNFTSPTQTRVVWRGGYRHLNP